MYPATIISHCPDFFYFRFYMPHVSGFSVVAELLEMQLNEERITERK